ncbi:MAG: hypothetical protein CM15mP85_17790 [Rhodobacterales bacterium]|nr:MAG: hypothetical protein CM15mP85_17790 [Rhodobacterales bacterium]
MTFAPLSEVRDNLKPQWYRSKMNPDKFRAFSKRSDYKGLFKPVDILACFVSLAFRFIFHGSMATGLCFASLFFSWNNFFIF